MRGIVVKPAEIGGCQRRVEGQQCSVRGANLLAHRGLYSLLCYRTPKRLYLILLIVTRLPLVIKIPKVISTKLTQIGQATMTLAEQKHRKKEQRREHILRAAERPFFSRIPIVGPFVRRLLIAGMEPFAPRVEDNSEAATLIRAATTCAAGPCVCYELHPESVYTESIFLDELADSMVRAGNARYVTPEEAIDVLYAYSTDRPIIVTNVSGKPCEISSSSRKWCVAWNMELNGLKCVIRELEK